jgi:type III pantothenate kinase
VGENLEPPISVDLSEPTQVGTDRLCAAAAAYAKVKGACVVADIGTATTIDLVSDNGVFLGGTIVPGIKLCARALHEHTAQLPLVEEVGSGETLGKDTAAAIRNGVFAMMCGALREITERYATDIGKWPPLILTGGDARKVADACDFVDALGEDLSLDGLALAYELAFGDHEA